MNIKTINRGAPEVVVIGVKNVDTVALTVGMLAGFACEPATVPGDGFSVVRTGVEAGADLAWGFAGVVINKSISAQDFGILQVYGHCDCIQLYGGTMGLAAGEGIAATNPWNWTSLTNRIMRPYNFVTTESQGFGKAGVHLMPVQTGTQAVDANLISKIKPGGYIVPEKGPALAASFTPTSTGNHVVKGFIHCL